jgi:NAD(P)-dependent dehydrogenase (short-subunit alcohol dehydrogenase family)
MTAALALITGGAQGIGRALTQSFLADGWRVVVLDRDTEALGELTADSGGSALLGLAADVGEEMAVATAFAAIQAWQDRAGEPAGLNLLVNNAGLADPVSGQKKGPGSFKVGANRSNKGVRFLAIHATSLMGRTRGGGSARPSALKWSTTSRTTSQSSP